MFSVNEQDQFLAQKGVFTYAGIKQAYVEQSPRLAEFICKLLILNPAPRQMFIAQRRGTPTFLRFSAQVQSAVEEQVTLLYNDEKAKTANGQISPIYSVQYKWRGHQKVWNHLTSDTMRPLLPERIQLFEIVIDLWNDPSGYARQQLLDILRYGRLLYGLWRAVKVIFKEAEERFDWEVYAILTERFKQDGPKWWYQTRTNYIWISPAEQAQKKREIQAIQNEEAAIAKLQQQIADLKKRDALTASQQDELEDLAQKVKKQKETLANLQRVGRYEPRLFNWSRVRGSRSVDKYGDVESESYSAEPSKKTFSYLERRARRTFRNLAKDFPEAFPGAAAEMLMTSSTLTSAYIQQQEHLWLDQMSPLLKVVEQSRSETNVSWAYELLCKRYRLEMKKVSSQWLYRVSQSKYDFTHQLALNYLQNATGVEEGEFHKVGYHKTIIGFLGFDTVQHSDAAIAFAVSYLQSVSANPENAWLVQALPLENISRLLRSSNAKLRDLGMHLLQGNDGVSPYEDTFTRDFFTTLLADKATFQFASKEIRKRYTSLPPEWYIDLLLSPNWNVRQFAQDLLRDSTMVAADADWSDFCIKLLTAIEAPAGTYKSAWLRLNANESSGAKLIQNRAKIPFSFLRFLFIHPSAEVRRFASQLIEERVCTVAELDIEFLKTIATQREHKMHLEGQNPWSDFVGSYASASLVEYLRDNIDKDIYSDAIGRSVRTWLYNEFHLSQLGLEWSYKRVQWFASQYDFVRKIFLRDVAFSQLADLLPPLTKDEFKSTDATINGARQVAWFVYHHCFDAGSKKANFYKNLLLHRNPRFRQHQGLVELTDARLVLPQEAFDFVWFTRWAKSKRQPIRDFAVELARYEMAYWVQKDTIGFASLRPFFSGFYDIQQAITRAIYKPLQPVNCSRIDIENQSGFLPNELYTYCFGSDDRPRDFALQVIQNFPQKFGQPQDLLRLSDSKSPEVRQVVIEVLWSLYQNPSTTPGWKPFPYSVVPFDLSRAIDPIREQGEDPNSLSISPADVPSSKHFLGPGTKPVQTAKSLDEASKFDLHEFLRRILYTLPRSPKQATGVQAARNKASANQQGEKMAVKSSWKNKHTLVAAIRDLAIKDQAFALFVLPILEEFKSVRSKMLHNACLTALVQIKNTHQI